MSSKPILYSYFRSSCSWRVRAALELKDVDYEYKAVNLLQGEQLSEEFAKINPQREVPVFVENGHVLTQSGPIIEYLEETIPDSPLLPKDPILRAKIRAITQTIGGEIQPIQNLRVLKHVGAEKQKEWGRYWIEQGFKKLEEQIQPLHGKCCVGDTITMADLFLVPQVFNANRFEVDMGQFPLLEAINVYLLGQEAFKVSHPFAQPDCPTELK